MKCPGQDSRFWKLDAIFDVKCPNCGHLIEFFKDDTKRRCPNCSKDVPNPHMDFGCAAYCPYAEHCLGALPKGAVADGKLKMLKAKMLRLIKDEVAGNSKKMSIATRFLEISEELGKKEGVRLGPLLIASFLVCLKSLSDMEKNNYNQFLKELEAEKEVISEALTIFSNYKLKNNKDLLKESKVLLDTWSILEIEKDKIAGNKKTNGLLTTAARDLARIITSS